MESTYRSKFVSPVFAGPLLHCALLLKKFDASEKRSARCQKWAARFYRLALKRPFKHISSIDPRLDLREIGSKPGCKEILWHGKVVGQTHSLDQIHNSVRGDCFIAATGPSINEANLSLLSGRTIFGVNGALPKLRQFGLTPYYYAVADVDFAQNRFEMVREIVASGAKCFFSPKVISVIGDRDPSLLRKAEIYLVEPVNKLYGVPRLNWKIFKQENRDLVYSNEPDQKSGRIGFSTDLRKGLFTASTIVFGSLQTAYHLGFRRLFILGMDLDYGGSSSRYYETGKHARPSQIEQLYEPVIRPSFELLSTLCRQNLLEVFNLSNKSRLPAEIIPRLTLEDAIGQIPQATSTRSTQI